MQLSVNPWENEKPNKFMPILKEMYRTALLKSVKSLTFRLLQEIPFLLKKNANFTEDAPIKRKLSGLLGEKTPVGDIRLSLWML